MGLSEALANYFDVHKHGFTIRTETLASITTFPTVSYIAVADPSFLADQPYIEGVDGIAITGYMPSEAQSMLAVITIFTTTIATTAMTSHANRPFAQAPGLDLSAFFAFAIVRALDVLWQTALATVFIERLIFIALTAVGAREAIIRMFPEPVKMAVGTGIGLFLAIIELQAVDIVVSDNLTLVTMGNLTSNPIAIVSIVGLFFTFTLYTANVPGSIIIGIVGISLPGWGLAASDVILAEAGPVANPSTATYNITPLAGTFISGFGNVETSSFALVAIAFFFIDFFDTASTLVGVRQAGGFLNDDGGPPDIGKSLMADAVGATVGAILSISTVTAYIESATGVEEGGRAGFATLVVTLLFLGSLAIVPLAAAIPQHTSHIALIIIGVIMLCNVVDIKWDDLTFTVPADMTILITPFTYSIAYGVAAGIVLYPLVKVAVDEYDDVSTGQQALAVALVLYFVVRTSGMLRAQV